MRWFCCLLVTGIQLTEDMRMALHEEARKMFRSSDEKRNVRTKDLEGQVRTDFWVYSVGMFCGVLFTATIETDRGKGIVRYLFEPTESDRLARHLEEHAVATRGPEPTFTRVAPLEEFYGQRASS